MPEISTATSFLLIHQVSYPELPQPTKESVGSLQKGMWRIDRNPIYDFAITLSVRLELAKVHWSL